MFLISTLLVILGLTLAAVNSDDCPLVVALKQKFANFDLNNDGVLEKTELATVFGSIDTNNDGKLSEAEYLNATVLPVFMATLHFHYFDKNTDGFLEVTDIAHVFHTYDNDENDEITRSEFLSHYGEIEEE